MEVTNLQELYNLAARSGRIIDVSNIDLNTGKGAELVIGSIDNRPELFWKEGLAIASSRLPQYVAAIQLLFGNQGLSDYRDHIAAASNQLRFTGIGREREIIQLPRFTGIGREREIIQLPSPPLVAGPQQVPSFDWRRAFSPPPPSLPTIPLLTRESYQPQSRRESGGIYQLPSPRRLQRIPSPTEELEELYQLPTIPLLTRESYQPQSRRESGGIYQLPSPRRLPRIPSPTEEPEELEELYQLPSPPKSPRIVGTTPRLLPQFQGMIGPSPRRIQPSYVPSPTLSTIRLPLSPPSPTIGQPSVPLSPQISRPQVSYVPSPTLSTIRLPSSPPSPKIGQLSVPLSPQISRPQLSYVPSPRRIQPGYVPHYLQ